MVKQKYKCKLCGNITIEETGWRTVPCRNCGGVARNTGIEGRIIQVRGKS